MKQRSIAVFAALAIATVACGSDQHSSAGPTGGPPLETQREQLAAGTNAPAATYAAADTATPAEAVAATEAPAASEVGRPDAVASNPVTQTAVAHSRRSRWTSTPGRTRTPGGHCRAV